MFFPHKGENIFKGEGLREDATEAFSHSFLKVNK